MAEPTSYSLLGPSASQVAGFDIAPSGSGNASEAHRFSTEETSATSITDELAKESRALLEDAQKTIDSVSAPISYPRSAEPTCVFSTDGSANDASRERDRFRAKDDERLFERIAKLRKEYGEINIATSSFLS